jgi:hypothetical protein
MQSRNTDPTQFVCTIGRNKLKNGAIALTLQIKTDNIVLAGDRRASAFVVNVSVEIAAAQEEATGLADHFAARFAHL